jgi:hypothetical protein
MIPSVTYYVWLLLIVVSLADIVTFKSKKNRLLNRYVTKIAYVMDAILASMFVLKLGFIYLRFPRAKLYFLPVYETDHGDLSGLMLAKSDREGIFYRRGMFRFGDPSGSTREIMLRSGDRRTIVIH